MGDLLGSFSGSVWARTKHAGKTCGDLWGQSTILEAVIGKTCDREGSGHYSWYQSWPATVSCAGGWIAHGQSLSGTKILGVDRCSRGLVSWSVSEAQRERCALQVGVIVTPRVWLKRIEVTTYITKGASFFSGSPLLRTLQLSVLTGEQSWDGWSPGKFSGQHVSKDEARRKDLWWFVGPVDDPWSRYW